MRVSHRGISQRSRPLWLQASSWKGAQKSAVFKQCGVAILLHRVAQCSAVQHGTAQRSIAEPAKSNIEPGSKSSCPFCGAFRCLRGPQRDTETCGPEFLRLSQCEVVENSARLRMHQGFCGPPALFA